MRQPTQNALLKAVAISIAAAWTGTLLGLWAEASYARTSLIILTTGMILSAGIHHALPRIINGNRGDYQRYQVNLITRGLAAAILAEATLWAGATWISRGNITGDILPP